jgi:acrylyl-CoA reductase (NADPH)
MFKALVLEKNPSFNASVREVDETFLPDGDVTIGGAGDFRALD